MLILYRIFTLAIYYFTLPFTFSAHIFGSVKWTHRLGHIEPPTYPGGTKTIWLHASSMGEIQVLKILKEYLEKTDNSISIFITAMTDAGYKIARDISDDKSRVSFYPLDYIGPVRRFLDAVKPDSAVFIETEIWPNMIVELGRRHVPIFLVNGRLSERSYRRYRKFRNSFRNVFKNYSRLMVQTKADRDRYLGIGAYQDKIDIIGNLKFDAAANILPEDKKAELRRALPFPRDAGILVAGSTRRVEHDIILGVFSRLKDNLPDIRLILVPRHLDKIGDIKKLTEKYQCRYILFSELSDSTDDCPVIIVDVMGILNDLYAVSDIAFVGGTLVDIGGHNILEPVWAGIPVLYGPSIYNVRDSSKYILKNRFGEMIRDKEELFQKLLAYFRKELEFCKKGEHPDEESRASQTAQIILDYIKENGENLAENN